MAQRAVAAAGVGAVLLLVAASGRRCGPPPPPAPPAPPLPFPELRAMVSKLAEDDRRAAASGPGSGWEWRSCEELRYDPAAGYPSGDLYDSAGVWCAGTRGWPQSTRVLFVTATRQRAEFSVTADAFRRADPAGAVWGGYDVVAAVKPAGPATLARVLPAVAAFPCKSALAVAQRRNRGRHSLGGVEAVAAAWRTLQRYSVVLQLHADVAVLESGKLAAAVAAFEQSRTAKWLFSDASALVPPDLCRIMMDRPPRRSFAFDFFGWKPAAFTEPPFDRLSKEISSGGVLPYRYPECALGSIAEQQPAAVHHADRCINASWLQKPNRCFPWQRVPRCKCAIDCLGLAHYHGVAGSGEHTAGVEWSFTTPPPGKPVPRVDAARVDAAKK